MSIQLPCRLYIVVPMGQHEEKSYYDGGCTRLRMHAFTYYGTYHGQYKEYNKDESLAVSGFVHNGKWHGFLTIKYKYCDPESVFVIKDKVVDIPFLPEKPKRLGYNRSRFDTLEI